MKVTNDGAVAVVTLDWPARRNALGPAQAQELAGALGRLAGAEDVAVVVLTGNGAFCAGGDLKAITELAAAGPDAVRRVLYGVFHELVRRLVAMPKPVLAAVDGPAIGLGMDLALACDWRAIGPGGWFRQGWADLGVIPGTGGELLLRRLAPTLLWSLLGSTVRLGSGEAARYGLAVAAPEGALPAAGQRAAAIARLPRPAIAAYVHLHRADLRAQLDAHLETCLELQTELVCSAEFQQRAARALEQH